MADIENVAMIEAAAVIAHLAIVVHDPTAARHGIAEGASTAGWHSLMASNAEMRERRDS